MPKDQLIIFLKAPRPGAVKTRLAETVGPAKATLIYREMVDTLISRLSPLKEVEVRYSPDDAREEIKSWLHSGWSAVGQGGGDLGEKLERAFAEAFARGVERVVIIGSDCPEVNTGDIRSAWKALGARDVVVGPAVDGGYWLIGLRSPQPDLFQQILWSSDQVLAQTLARAKSLKLSIDLLRILADTDTAEDWNAYVRERGKR